MIPLGGVSLIELEEKNRPEPDVLSTVAHRYATDKLIRPALTTTKWMYARDSHTCTHGYSRYDYLPQPCIVYQSLLGTGGCSL